ncbi:class II lanthipeptide, LchA2/BrtA2 family [Microbacterium sp. ZW T5_56]|uniref:class II lanthipeptide, LchA2/BrtA2 family n=1 Tax=Microbacterium sp. ZW T5_56 TaxID=3378081 RepID=UPI003853A583
MSNVLTARTGFIAEDELVQMSAQEQSVEAGGTTTVPCGVIGLTIAASAALPGFCPTGACTSRC